MFVQNIGVGHPRRVELLVVEPQVEPPFLCGMYEAVEHLELLLAFEVVVRIDIRGHTAVAVGDYPLDHGVLSPFVVGHAVPVDIHSILETRRLESFAQPFVPLYEPCRTGQKQRSNTEFVSCFHRIAVWLSRSRKRSISLLSEFI